MKKTNALITVLTVLIVLVVANFLASRHPLRVDLTKGGLYTLSSSTKGILKGLDDVVTVRLYFTNDLPPALAPLKREVDDILAEFKSVAGSRLQVEYFDPGSSPAEEQKAAMMGIPPLTVNVMERDKQEVAKIYLGAAVMYGGKQEVIPVVQKVGSLEYELAQAILKVSSKERPKIAWWSPGLAAAADTPAGSYKAIRELVSKRYSVTEIDVKTVSDLEPKKFAALILLSPRQMAEDELFALDQYIMNGGRVIALIDRLELGNGLDAKPVSTNASDILMGYGVTVEDALVLDQSNAMASFSGGYVTYHLPYPYWPDIRKGQFSSSSPVVSTLETAVLPWTSPLIVAKGGDGAARNIEVIATTTDMGAQVAAKDAKLDPQSAANTLLAGPRAKKDLIAEIVAPIKSGFGAGAKALPAGREFKSESTEGAKVFVVGSSHWIDDRSLQMFPANAVLFENALDSMAMGDALIGIRSKESLAHPIKVLGDGSKAVIRYANLAVGPVLVLVVGAMVYLVRRARKRMIREAYR